MLVVNKTKCTQIVYEHTNCIPNFIHPGMVIKSEAYKYLHPDFFEKFDETYLLKCKNVAFVRQYALGDIIQLIAACRNLKKNSKVEKITIITAERFAGPLKPLYNDFTFFTFHPGMEYREFDLLFVLDGILECDHSLLNKERSNHRVDIYLQSFGLHFPCQKDYNLWKPCSFSKVRKPNMGKKVVGLQIRGSGKMKTLPYDYVKKLAKALSENYSVALLDHEKSVGWTDKNIHNMCGLMSVHECVSFIRELDAIITMDSGMLWMAHAANCPTVLLLGPTREHERLSLHPQYPEKAKSVSISEMIGCSPCFETCCRCARAIDCMNDFDHNKLTSLILEKVKEVMVE